MNRKDGKKCGGIRFSVWSFVIPFALMLVVFGLFEIYPFGDGQILVVDLYHQYFPFLSVLQSKLQSGGSLLYSWNIGLGGGFLPIIAYYTASPLNLLTVFASKAYLREALTLFLLIKIGAAGLCCSLFLRNVFKRNDLSVTLFGVMYALSGFVLGYYWNVIWLDTVAILPLVALGVYELIKNGKIKLYVISLFLSVFMNYYIGLFCCIFSAIMFFAVCILKKIKWRVMFKRLAEIIMCSAAALGVTGVLTVPTYLALKSASGMADRAIPTDVRWYHSVGELLSQMFNFFEPTHMEGLPNFYCGLACVLLILFFFMSKRIARREKAVTISILAFFMIGSNLNILDYILHGFHFPNMLPARFSFLFCFVIIAAAYRAFTVVEQCELRELLHPAAVGILFFVMCFAAKNKSIDGVEIPEVLFGYLAAALILSYIAACVLYKKDVLKKRGFAVTLCAVFAAEMFANAYFSAATAGTTVRSDYPREYQNTENLIAEAEYADSGFYRIEKAEYHTVNDGALYGYRGITQFSSTLNTNVAKLLEKIGMTRYVANNCYYYRFGSPVVNALFNVKYVLIDGNYNGSMPMLSEFGQSGQVKSYKNESYLPIGFMADRGIYSGVPDNLTVFDAQSALFGNMSGTAESVFETVAADRIYGENCEFSQTGSGGYYYSGKDNGQDGLIRAVYTMPESGTLYLYAKGRSNTDITVTYDGQSKIFDIDNPSVIAAGDYAAGDTVLVSYSVESDKTGNFIINAAMLDYDAFSRGFDKLADEPLEVYQFSDTKIRGSVNAQRDGVLYTSVPYEKGWTLYVDGKKHEIKPFENAFITAEISRGRHEIEFRYVPQGLYAGLLLTGASAVGILLLFTLYKSKTAEQIMLEYKNKREYNKCGGDGEQGGKGKS